MNLDPAFWPALWELARATQTRPEIYLAVWFAESGLDPAAANSIGCLGINQTCPTPVGPGFPGAPEAYKALPASDQLAWIASSIKQNVATYGPFRSGARYYQSNFLPATLGAARHPRDVVAAAAGPYAEAYRANAGLDVSGDGAITIEDLGRFLQSRVAGDATYASAVQQAYANRPADAPWSAPVLAMLEPWPPVRPAAGIMLAAALFGAVVIGIRRRHAA